MSFPIPPLVERTRGVKTLRSTSRTLLTVLSLLGLLMFSVGIRGMIAGCVRVDNPYIKKCILRIVPKASSRDIQSGIVSGVS